MKLKKIISALTAFAVVATALPVYSGLSAFATDKDTTGNTMFTAVDVSFDELITGKIDDAYDEDWYKFTVPTTGEVNLTLSITGGARIYDCFLMMDGTKDNNVLTSNKDISGMLRYTYYLTAGDYYFSLSRENSWDSNYEAKLSFTPYELTFDGVNNNSINKASEIELETNYSAHIANTDSKDYYTFNLAEDDDIALNFEGDIDSIDWILYNNKNEQILNGTYTRDNNTSDMIVSNNYVSLKSGKYTLAFNSNSDNYGTYNFSLSKYVDFEANGISMADFNDDGKIDASDATVLLEYYSYVSTGGEEKDMRNWLEEKK